MSAVTRACQNYFKGPAELSQPGHKVSGALKCISYIFLVPVIIMGFIWGVSSTIDFIKDRFSKKPPQIADKVSQTVQTKEPLKSSTATKVVLLRKAKEYAYTQINDTEKARFLDFVKSVVDDSKFQQDQKKYLEQQPWFQSRVTEEDIPIFDHARDFFALECEIKPRKGTHRDPRLEGYGEVPHSMKELFSRANKFIEDESDDKKDQFLDFVKKILNNVEFIANPKEFLEKQDWFQSESTPYYIFHEEKAASFFLLEFFPPNRISNAQFEDYPGL